MSRLDCPVRNRLLALAVSAVSVLAASAAFGADATPTAGAAKPPAKVPAKAADAKPREGSLGKGTSSGPLLTREQLRRCMVEQERQKQEAADLLQTQRALEKDRSEIDRLGAEMDAEKAVIDRTSQAAVDAYNERARVRGKIVDDYKAAAPQFNLRVDKLGADKEAYARECADRRYFEDDYDAIKAGK